MPLTEVFGCIAAWLHRCGSQALANSIWAVQRLTQQQQQQQSQASHKQSVSLPAAWRTAFLEALYTEPSLVSGRTHVCVASLLSCAVLSFELPYMP
jgi:hypothetical protein